MRGISKRVSCFILAVVMILQMSLPSYAWYIPESEQQKRDDYAYQYYLADFLKQYQLLGVHMQTNMLHKALFEELDQEVGETIQFSHLARTLSSTPFKLIDEKEKLYEQILLEILYKSLQSQEIRSMLVTIAEETQLELVSTRLQKAGIHEIHEQGFEFAEDIMEDKDVIADVIDIMTSTEELKRLDITSILNAKSLPIADILLAFCKNFSELCFAISICNAMVEYHEGIEKFLGQMKAQTTDRAMQNAIDSILVRLECVTEQDMARAFIFIEASEDGTAAMSQDLTGIFGKLLVYNSPFVALMFGRDVGYFITDAVFGTKETESMHLLLKSELEIEEVLLETLVFCRNNYHGDYESAIALNAGSVLLYDTYKYGLDIIEKYVDLIKDKAAYFAMLKQILKVHLEAGLKSGRNGILFGAEILEEYKNANFSKVVKSQEGREIFERLLKANRGLVANGRSVFVTMALAFDEEYLQGNKYKSFLNRDYMPVEGISLELPAQTVTYAPDSMYFCKVTFTPENATNQNVNYISTNTDVVEVDASGILKVKGTGVAVIIATSDDGLYTDRKAITVENEKEAIQEKYVKEVFSGEEFDYTPFYEKNEDGITLKSMVWYKSKEKGRYVTSTTDLENYWGGYVIPAYIDGMPVTELDFNGKMPKEGQTVGLVEQYLPWNEEENIHSPTPDNYVVVLPPTVKRIADNCFAGYYFGMSIELNEGLESIGERAFYQCDLFGYWGSWGTVWSDDFWGNNNISAVFVIPESVKEIGKSAFEEADFHYHSLEIRSLLEKIPERCFYGVKTCEGISFRYDDGIKVIGKEAFAGAETEIKGCAVLPASVERIEESAFENSTLELYELPKNLVSIGKRAFANSHKFELLDRAWTLPAKLKEIGEEAFLASFRNHGQHGVLEIPDSIQLIGKKAFYGNFVGIDQVISYHTEEEINYDGVLEDNAFGDCRSISLLDIPENIVFVGENALIDCTGLKEIVLPSRLNAMGKQSLQGLEGENIRIVTNILDIEEIKESQALVNAWLYDCGEGLNFARVDIPNAFTGEFNLGAFDEFVGEGKPKIERLTLLGQITGITEGSQAKEWADFVTGTVYAMDEQGAFVCLYWEPSQKETVRESKAKYESFEDYNRDLEILDSQYPDSTVPASAGKSKGSFVEGTPEYKAFRMFEQVYLEQENVLYMQLNLEQEQTTSAGQDYQTGDPMILKLEIPKDWSGNTSRYAVYYIGENGEIHRLEGSVKDDHFWALTYDLGYFALVELENLEETITESVDGVNKTESVSPNTKSLKKVIIEDGIFNITLWVEDSEIVWTTPGLTPVEKEALIDAVKLPKAEADKVEEKVQVLEFSVPEKKKTVVLSDISKIAENVVDETVEEETEIELYAFSVKENDDGEISLKKVRLKDNKDETKVNFKKPGTYWVVMVEKEAPNHKTMWIVLLVIAILILNPRRKRR